jgi:Rrf2 family protein
MLELAMRHGDPRPVRLTDVADRHGIPQRFLVQILLHLKSSGLVISTRGASGGYQLSRAPTEISLLDILNALDPTEVGDVRAARASSRSEDGSPLASALKEVWEQIAQSRQEILARTTLAKLCESGQGLLYVI